MKNKDIIINMKKQVTLIAMLLCSVLAWGQTIVGSGDGWSFDSEGVLTITKDFSYTVNEYCPWYKYCKSIKSVEFSDNVTTICRYAFRECNLLTDFTIPEGITKIEYEAFHDCKGLQSITIPKSIKSIAVAFSGCSNLKDAYFCGNIDDWVAISFAQNSFFSIIERLYIDNEEVHDVVISEGIENIKPFVFWGYAGLTSVVLPSTLKEIGTSAFRNCIKLESIFIPEGVEIIKENAFQNCSNLKSVVIPSTLKTIGIHAFDGCTGLESVVYKPQEELEIQNTTLNTVNAIFKNCNIKYVFFYGNCNTSTKTASTGDGIEDVFGWLCTVEMFFVPEEYYEEYSNRYQVENITKYNIIDSGEDEKFVYILEKNNYEKLGSWLNEGIEVEGDDISFILTEDFDLDAENVTWQTLGTAEHPFKGIFEGNGHSIIFGGDAANSDNTLFGHIDEGAEIRNLNVENMNVMSGDDNKVVDGEYTYYPILAKENRGTIKKCVVSGSVMCDEEIENDEKSIGCFIVDNYGTLDHVVEFYKYGIEAEGNKRNIVIMQNMGVGRNAGQTRKVCNNRKKKNKSLSATPSSDVNDDYREYTDEEMASGEPAYWLNYSGKGYTGDYTSEWSKGKMHPIMATELSKPAVKVVYEIEGASESYAGLKDPVFFANEDDEIEIETAVAPEKVWVGNNVVEELNSRTKLTKKLLSSAAKDGIITVHLMYSTATGIENAKAEKSIRVNGHAISIEGAEGESYSVVDVMGRTVAEGEANGEKTIVVPAAGIYVVKAGDRAQKIVVK